jgi:hypothetical protein
VARTFERAGLRLSWQSYFNTALFPIVAAVRWSRHVIGRADRPVSDFDRGGPGIVNDGLTRLFASERHVLRKLRLPFGVSLAALARLP